MSKDYRSTYRVINSDECYASRVECMGCRSSFSIMLQRNYTDDDTQTGDYADFNRPFAFCPVCGGMFSGKLDARPTWIPRWAWDRYRVGDEVRHDIGLYAQSKPSPATGATEWQIETRARWFSDELKLWDEWSEWKPPRDGCRGHFAGDARQALAILRRERGDNDPEDITWLKCEYRVRLYRHAQQTCEVNR